MFKASATAHTGCALSEPPPTSSDPHLLWLSSAARLRFGWVFCIGRAGVGWCGIAGWAMAGWSALVIGVVGLAWAGLG
eukprot:7024433-Pyramimonas_sp.AAC.1